MAGKKPKDNSLLKVIGTDIAGVICLILVPILGPLPGPGGIPLLVTGLGLLAINHDWAKDWLSYVKKHSESVRDIMFPDTTWAKWGWDIIAASLLIAGLWINLFAEWWLIKGMSIGMMASSTTLFLLNRNRIAKLDEKLRGKK